MVCLSALGLEIACAQHTQNNVRRFDFGNGLVAAECQPVTDTMVYSRARGYGFIGPDVMAGKTNKGNGQEITADYLYSARPFYFAVDMPEGNYRVTFLLGGGSTGSNMTIKAESRRLMFENVEVPAHSTLRKVCMINVRSARIAGNDSIRLKSREYKYLNWDGQLTLEFNGLQPCVQGIEIEPVPAQTPVLFLAGNSTVVDQEKEPWAAWGQMIPRFFKPDIVVANFAESGETLKSFERERRLEKVMSLMKPGDYLFIEFAHNDQKPGSAHVEPFTTYKDAVKSFILQARAHGGIPVLVTSMHRRRFDSEGHIINTLDNYPEAMRQIALEEQVPLIDLNVMSKKFYEALGEEASKKVFVHYPPHTYPGQEQALADDTHFSNYGAYQLARCVVEGIRHNIPSLAKHIIHTIPSYDPAQPHLPEHWYFSDSPVSIEPLVKPDGN